MPKSLVVFFALEQNNWKVRTNEDSLFRGHTFISVHSETLFGLKLGAIAKAG